MPAQDIGWTTSAEPVSDERIMAVQATLGVKLPDSFLDCVRKWNSGHPEPDCFLYLDTQENRWDQGSVGALLDFREPMDKYLKDIYRNDRDLWRDMDIEPWWTIEDHNVLNRADHFTPGLIAFTQDGGGNFTCFDYRSGRSSPDPPIVFWHHELHACGEEPFFVAKNFGDFLEMLRPCLDLIVKVEAAGQLHGRTGGVSR